MTQQMKEKAKIDRNLAAIREVQEKRTLVDKCHKKMEMAALDQDDVSILEAASERLIEDINLLCWRIGL